MTKRESICGDKRGEQNTRYAGLQGQDKANITKLPPIPVQNIKK